MVAVNMKVSTNRRPPTYQTRCDALNDIWIFADMIGFRGGSKSFGRVHREMTEFLLEPQVTSKEDCLQRLIIAPRGHLKSTVCSVLYSMWRLYRNPDIRILIATALKRLSRSIIREMRQYFEDGWLQQHVWNVRPHVEGPMIPALSAADRRKRNSQRNNNDDEGEENLAADSKMIWSGEAIQIIRPTIAKEPSVQCLSAGTSVTGDHYDLIIRDDLVSFENSDTPEKAAQLHEWTLDLVSVVDPRVEHQYQYEAPNYHKANKAGRTMTLVDFVGDEVVTLGTRYFAWDYYAYLIENAEELMVKTFIRNIYINGQDDSEGYLWPEKFNREALERKKRDMNNPRRFSSQYLNKIIAEEDVVFHDSSIKGIAPNMIDNHKNGEVTVRRSGGEATRVKLMMVVDPAVSMKKGADNSVITVGGYCPDKELYILDCKVGQFKPTEIIDHIHALADKWGLNSVTLETVGGFALLRYQVQESFRTRRHLAIREYRPHKEKKGRITSFLEPHFVNCTLNVTSYLIGLGQFRDELANFPNGHDDILDTLAMICELAVPARKEGAKKIFTPHQRANSKYGGIR